jgi:hypothetical protein
MGRVRRKGRKMKRHARLRSATVVVRAGKETTRRVPRLVSRKTVAVSAAAIADADTRSVPLRGLESSPLPWSAEAAGKPHWRWRRKPHWRS